MKKIPAQIIAMLPLIFFTYFCFSQQETNVADSISPALREKIELMGKDAPPFSVTDMSGKNYSLEELKGKVVVLNFWFIGCKPCVMEMPELNELVRKYRKKEVSFLAFARNEKAKVADFLITHQFDYAIIADAQEIITKYGIRGFPTNIVIDKDSKIIHMRSGYREGFIKELKEVIQKALN